MDEKALAFDLCLDAFEGRGCGQCCAQVLGLNVLVKSDLGGVPGPVQSTHGRALSDNGWRRFITGSPLRLALNGATHEQEGGEEG